MDKLGLGAVLGKAQHRGRCTELILRFEHDGGFPVNRRAHEFRTRGIVVDHVNTVREPLEAALHADPERLSGLMTVAAELSSGLT